MPLQQVDYRTDMQRRLNDVNNENRLPFLINMRRSLSRGYQKSRDREALNRTIACGQLLDE